tara:strand:+ start:1184 stop:1582 length:399 start_codon:yes stop_codon:yes gene_type:complete
VSQQNPTTYSSEVIISIYHTGAFMRIVEENMNTAIRYRRNWASSNTMVRCFKEVVEVYLHGNHIASVDTATNNLTLFDGGWQSVTTKSRLNALLTEFTHGGLSVVQRNFDWFIRDNDFTNKPLVPFVSGMQV